MNNLNMIDEFGDELIDLVSNWYKKIRKNNSLDDAEKIICLVVQDATSKLNPQMFMDIDIEIGKLKTCKNCGNFFEVHGNRKVFCSKECSDYYFGHRSHFRGPDGRNRR